MCAASQKCMPSGSDCYLYNSNITECAAKKYCRHNGVTCDLADVSKHPCAVNTDERSCGAAVTLGASFTCAMVPTCYDRCAAAQGCLNLVSSTLINTTRSLTDAAAIASEVSRWCVHHNYSTLLCAGITATVKLSTNGNLGKRAGALCSMLDEIPVTSFGCNFSAGSKIGGLDECSIEGVAGGTSINVTSNPPPVGSAACHLDSDCSAAGEVCQITGDYYNCSCANGVDRCKSIGVCTNTCDLTSVTNEVTRLNELVSGGVATEWHCMDRASSFTHK